MCGKFFEAIGEKKVRCKLCDVIDNIHAKLFDEPPPDKYAYMSGKDSKSQCKIDSFVHENRCSPVRTKEKTRPII